MSSAACEEIIIKIVITEVRQDETISIMNKHEEIIIKLVSAEAQWEETIKWITIWIKWRDAARIDNLYLKLSSAEVQEE